MAQTQIIVSARDMATRTFRQIGLASQALTSKIFNMRNALMGGAVAGMAAMVRQSIEATDQIGKVADKVGLTTDQLQELRYAANLAGVAQSQLDMGMQRFSRRLGEVSQGQGELLKTSKQYGVELRNADGSMRSNIDLLGDWSEVIKNAESDQEALRIAFKLFDSEGAALVNMLRGGSEGLKGMRREARELGLVIDESLVRSSEKANDQLTKMEMLVRARFRSTLAELAPDIADVADNMADWVRENREFMTQGIPQYMRNIADGVGAIGNSISEMKGSWDNLPEDLRNILVGGGIARWLLGAGGARAFGGAYAFGKGVEGMTNWRKSLDENKDSWTWDVTGNWNEMIERMGLGASDDVQAVVKQLRAQREHIYDARVGMIMREQEDPRNLDFGSGIVSKPWQNVPTTATAAATELTDQQIKLREKMTREIQRLTMDQFAFARAEAERTYQKDLEIAGKSQELIAQAGERRRLSLASIAEEETKQNRQQAEQAAQAQRDLTAEIERATLGRYEAQRRETKRYYDDLVKRAEAAGRETVSIEQGRADRIAEINESEREDARQTAEEMARGIREAHVKMLQSSDSMADGFELAMERMGETSQSVAERTADVWQSSTRQTANVITDALMMQEVNFGNFLASLQRKALNTFVSEPLVNGLMGGAGTFLKKIAGFDSGGISYGPQLAMVSEGAIPVEAHVPLPDGHTIPVTVTGMGGGQGGIRDVKINIYNQGGQAVDMSSYSARIDETDLVIDCFLKGLEENRRGVATLLQGGQF